HAREGEVNVVILKFGPQEHAHGDGKQDHDAPHRRDIGLVFGHLVVVDAIEIGHVSDFLADQLAYDARSDPPDQSECNQTSQKAPEDGWLVSVMAPRAAE